MKNKFESIMVIVWFFGLLSIYSLSVPAPCAALDIFVTSGQALGASDTTAVALGDIDGDNDLDAFVGNYAGHPNRVWLNNGNGNFTDSGQALGVPQSYDVTLGDLDGDNDLDAWVGNFWVDDEVWLNDGNGNFMNSGQSLGGFYPGAVALGDLDGDNDLDALVANQGEDGGPNTVWLNDGNGIFTVEQRLGEWDSHAVALGDLDGDNDLDAFVGNFYAGNKVWLNDGTGNFTDSGQSLGNSDSIAVALGDLDGDNDLDAFIGNNRSEPNKVWLNDGDGNFIDSGQTLGSSRSLDVALGDLDGDKDLDVLVMNYQNEPDAVWLNDGNGNFVESGQVIEFSYSSSIALGDLDDDNDLDTFVGKSSANEVWLNIFGYKGDFDLDGDVDGSDLKNKLNYKDQPSLEEFAMFFGGFICIDIDEDGYGRAASDLCPNAVLDCNDKNPNISPGVNENCITDYDDNCNGTNNDLNADSCLNYYRDFDNDGFGDAGIAACYCLPSPPSYTVTNSDDCCDYDAAVYPGAPLFYSYRNLCGRFDYNCDGINEGRWTDVGDCSWVSSAKCNMNEGWHPPVPGCGEVRGWVYGCSRLVVVCLPWEYDRHQECR